MNRRITGLLRAELLQLTSTATVLSSLVILVLVTLTVLIDPGRQTTFDVAWKLDQALTFAGFLAVGLLTTGIISNDLRSGWMRTVMARPVTRTEYFVAKAGTAWIVTGTVAVLAAVVPVAVRATITPLPVTLNPGMIAAVVIFLFLECCLLSILSAALSCLVPGLVNVLVLGAWGTGSSLIGAKLLRTYGAEHWSTRAAEYLFPSGFLDAITAFKDTGSMPAAQLLWGCAACAGALCFGILAVNRLTLDRDKG